MESLNPKTQEQIKKMSTEYLYVKLAKAGYDEEAIVKMSREQLIAAWAELVAAGKDKPHAPTLVHADPALEQKRLEFEMLKYREQVEREEKLRVEQLAREEKLRVEELTRIERLRAEQYAREDKLRAEQLQREERAREEQRKREEAAAKEREAMLAVQHEELKLQQQQLDLQIARDKREKEKRSSVATQLKLFGDIVKNVAPKFPADNADIPMFFESFEKVLSSTEAPEALHAKLLIPHSSERARSLLLRLDQTRQNDYDEVKNFLLNEFQLTAFQFKTRFDNAKRKGVETWTLFCARLKNLLEYYCRSRDVAGEFERLFTLSVADRLKSMLPQQCLNFVLATESTDTKLAFDCDRVANLADVYFANHAFDGRPKVAGFEYSNRGINKSATVKESKSVGSARSEGAAQKNESPVGKTASYSTRVRCFACNQFGHTKKSCPNRSASHSEQTVRKTFTSARVQACAVRPGDATSGVQNRKLQSESADISDGDRIAAIDAHVESKSNNVCVTPTAVNNSNVVGHRPNLDGPVRGAASYSSERTADYPTQHTDIRNNDVAQNCHASVMTESYSPNTIAEKFVPLDYVRINIVGVPDTFAALNDSGTQVNLIHRSLTPEEKLKSVGQIAIRGAFGSPVHSEVVMLAVKPATSAPNEVNVAPSREVLFAVCEDLNEHVILTADTVRQLELLKTYNVIHIPELITAKSQVEHVGNASDSSEISDILPLDGRAETLIPCDTDVSNDSDGESASIVDDSPGHVESVSADDDLRCADAVTLRNEQLTDPALAKYWNFAREEKCGFFLKDGLLYRHGKVNGEKVIQLCLPETRIDTVLELAHDMPFSGHMVFRRTNDRVSLNFFFPGQRARLKDYCMRCEKCQLFAPARRDDLNVIEPIPRNAQPFGHLVFDCVGPFGDAGRYKYAFVITDLNTRFPMAYALTNISAKKICDCLLDFFRIFSMPSVVHCDMGTNFTSDLTKLRLTRLGCAPRFNSSYHPQSTGLVERTNASL
jgi:hypothetical protein